MSWMEYPSMMTLGAMAVIRSLRSTLQLSVTKGAPTGNATTSIEASNQRCEPARARLEGRCRGCCRSWPIRRLQHATGSQQCCHPEGATG